MALTRYNVTYTDTDGNTQTATNSQEASDGNWVRYEEANEQIQTLQSQQDGLDEDIETLKEAFKVTEGQSFNKMIANVSDPQAYALKRIFSRSSES